MAIEWNYFRITRNPVAGSGGDGGISIEEWHAYLKSDSLALRREFLMGRSPKDGTPIKVKLNNGAVWLSENGEYWPAFRFRNGAIVSLGTDEMEHKKANEIAAALNATVVIEEYD